MSDEATDDSPLGFWKAGLTPTQHHFVAWNAQRLGLPLARSYERYHRSDTSLPGGLAGPEYRRVGNLMHAILGVLSDDSPNETFHSYRMHAPMHFLRMLSYPEPEVEADHPIVRHLSRLDRIDIVDFGCGLAQAARSLARRLVDLGKPVTLTLCDIPTIRKDFLLWLGPRTGLDIRFLDCTEARPIPDLPASDMVLILEVFEHLHDPMPYLEAIAASMRPGALLLTDVGDHQSEPFHVSPELGALRERLAGDDFTTVRENKIFLKGEPA